MRRAAPPPVTRLTDLLVDQIAAGEVIERPAAAAKELIENALDAGAERITVALDGGGIDRIEVGDDGHGMGPADLRLSVERHCTSKLADGDLGRITTLGFRGEALASIGAAARLTVVSRAAGAPHGVRVTVEGGRVDGPTPCAAPFGTVVVVADLFHATPARRRFLKGARAEAEHALAAVRRLALAAPAVSFRVTVDGRPALELPAADARDRAAAILGVAADALVPVRHERDALLLDGHCLAASHTRPTGSGVFLVVNGRPVVDPVLRTAIRVAYAPLIERGRHPLVALRLSVPTDAVDANVHPAKTELRFRDPDAVRALVIGGLGRALAPDGAAPRRFGAPSLRLLAARPPVAATARSPSGFAERALPFDTGPAARALPAPAVVADHPLGAPIAQVFDTFVLAVTAAGELVLVDQHAAHERLTHEQLLAEQRAGAVRAQALLIPAVVELPPGALGPLLAEAAALATLGVELEPFGAGAVLVRALPALLGAADPAPLLRDVADELATVGASTALADRLAAVTARLACHGSIRAGRRLDQAAMAALLRAIEAEPRAATCPHGRPTVLTLSRGAIERMFGRA